MTKLLVCYHSKSGTTESMAQEIVKGIEGSEIGIDVDLKKVEETKVESLTDYDGIILGSPTYYGLPSAEIKKFIDESVKLHGKLEGKVGGAFSSSANKAGGNETTIMAMLEAFLIHGMIVKGTPNGDHYGPVVVGSQSGDDLEQCRNYGMMMVELTERME